MKRYQPAARNDTMLGVCQSLGEDFGIHPNILRVAFGVGLIVQPVASIAGYLALAVVIALSHWAFPKPRPADESAVAEIAPYRAGGASANEGMAEAA
jgi:phage shock protein PspC (stress-responsive transcriptional regulator)